MPKTKIALLVLFALVLLALVMGGWKWTNHGQKQAGWTWDAATQQQVYVADGIGG